MTTHDVDVIVIDLSLRVVGWLVAVLAFVAALGSRWFASAAMVLVAVTFVSTGRDMRYRRLARQLDRWNAEDVEVASRRRFGP